MSIKEEKTERTAEGEFKDGSGVPWRAGDVLSGFVLFVAVIVTVSLLQNYPGVPRVLRSSIFLSGYLIGAVIIWHLTVNRYKVKPQLLGFRSFSLVRSLIMAVLWIIGLRFGTAIYILILEAFGFSFRNPQVIQIPRIFGSDFSGFLLAVLIASVIAPVVEELFFRGFIYPVFRRTWGVRVGILANGLLFSFVHFNPWLFLPIAGIGVVLAYEYERTTSLGPPIILHALNNLFSIILLYYRLLLL
jgi:membrane protease YdiL (CAAX protease family)